MATLITKNSSTASSVPTAAQLVQGELAVNVTDKRLFTENSSGTVVELGTNPSTLALPNGSANGVAYLNGSKVLTTGSALTFDGSKLLVGSNTAGYGTLNVARDTTTPYASLTVTDEANANNTVGLYLRQAGSSPAGISTAGAPLAFYLGGSGTSEQMRLTSTGLGIGTSSPTTRLQIGDATVSTANKITFGKTTATTEATLPTVYAGSLLVPAASVDLVLEAGSTSGGIAIRTAGSTRAVVDSSGNLGLGVTPSAWGSPYKALQLNGGSVATYSNAAIEVYQNGVDIGDGAWRYVTSNLASRYAQVAGQHRWFTAASGTAGNAITFTQAMTLDASGNLGVGTTSPSTFGKLAVYGSGTAPVIGAFLGSNSPATGATLADLSFGARTDGTVTAIIRAIANDNGNGTDGQLTFWTADNTASAAAAERARITSDGGFWVGTTTRQSTSNNIFVATTEFDWVSNFQCNTTTAANNLGILIRYNGAVSNGTGNQFIRCEDTTNIRLEVRSNGGIANYQANDVNLSDRREKTNFAPAGEYLSKICAIPVQTFNYIDQSEDDPGLTLGVVAQDVQAVAPELVMESNWGTEEDPKMRLSIYQTDLQYALMKCIQEQQAIIETLTARVAALESK